MLGLGELSALWPLFLLLHDGVESSTDTLPHYCQGAKHQGLRPTHRVRKRRRKEVSLFYCWLTARSSLWQKLEKSFDFSYT